MRILNFMNVPFTPGQIRGAGIGVSTSGGWMTALLCKIHEHTDFTIGTVSYGDVLKISELHEDRIFSFTIPAASKDKKSGLAMCCEIVNAWKPDLIHIHGTENTFGLLTARDIVRCPAVISIQGLLGPCSEWYRYFGNRSLLDIIKMHRLLEIPALRGHWIELLKIKKMAVVERECIIGNRFFMGRTSWDQAYVKFLNPTAHYFYGGELLRDPFWKKRWNISTCQRHRIMFTNAGHPRKGAQVVFDAVRLLQPEYPDIQVVIAGGISHRNGYGKYIRQRMSELGNVHELGPLNAEQMADELVASHLFVSPSFIENSSNACCEAQLLGMPVISSYTGGMPSLVQDGYTGLFFPTGDAAMLAARLKEVFENDDLATRLGGNAHEVACQRHDPTSVLDGILDVYVKIMRQAL